MTPDIHERLKDGRKHKVTEDDFEYFLNVLPPVCMQTTYQGESWSFGFAEGAETVRLFKKQGDAYFAIATPYPNPRQCGPIESQKKRWVMQWLQLGKKNAWIRRAYDPPFSTQSFHECATDQELLEKFKQRNWCLGQAFYLGNFCFINQVDGGDEWLTIKGDTAFESISFGRIIRDEGMQAAQQIIDEIRTATVDQCRRLQYGRGG